MYIDEIFLVKVVYLIYIMYVSVIFNLNLSSLHCDIEFMFFSKFLRVHTYGPRREKTCLWAFANNISADQPDERLCYSLIGKYHQNLP